MCPVYLCGGRGGERESSTMWTSFNQDINPIHRTDSPFADTTITSFALTIDFQHMKSE